MPSSCTVLRGLKVLAFSALLFACQPKIGDDCSTSTDCSSQGSRSCDTTMTGGYCTIFNCEPDSCPEEAACIGFALDASTASDCENLNESRQLRTFCMLRCSNDGDCRSGYECIDMNQKSYPNSYPWTSALVDVNRSSGKVCAVKAEVMSVPDGKGSVCKAGEYVDKGYYDVSSGGASNGGAGGVGGVGGATSVTEGGSTSGGATSVTEGGSTSGGAGVGGALSSAVAGATQ